MSDWAIVTIVTRNYLHFARSLALSVRTFHPDARIIACVPDPIPDNQKSSLDGLEILPLDAIKIPQASRFIFQYTPFELTCALKSFVLEHVFHSTGLSRLLYFDGDIQVYAGLSPLLDLLKSNNILLTPHLTKPSSLTTLDQWEMDVLDTGTFNGGFVGVRNSEAGLNMLTWWKSRMIRLCKWDINHHDQGWLDAVPSLFDGVQIERGTQYNAANWNLASRRFSETSSGEVLVDGWPLVFFHFASVEPEQTQRLSKVSRRALNEEPAPVQKLFHQYIARLQESGMKEYQSLGYGRARLADGSTILPEWRELIRTDHPAFLDVPDPFAVSAAAYQRVALGQKLNRQFRRVLRGLKFSRPH